MVLLAAAAPFLPAFAGPPFVTDDPIPVDLGHWEINNALTGMLIRGSATAFLPSIDANYGILPGVQFHVQPQFAVNWTSTGINAGFGDTQIGAKVRLSDEQKDGWLPAIAIYPIVTVPTGNASRGLGSGHTSTFLPVWVDKTFGKWVLDGGAGYSINPGAAGRNAWFVGGILLYAVTEKLQLGGEAYLQTAQTRGAPNTPAFNLGGTYDFSDRYHLLFSAGQGLANVAVTDRFGYYVALQLTF